MPARKVDLARFQRLLHPPEPWEAHLPPGMAESLRHFREVARARGLERGTLKAAADASGMLRANFHKSLCQVLARAERYDGLKARGITPINGMDVRRVSTQHDKRGRVKQTSVVQTPVNGDVDPGEPLPGFAYKRISTLSDGQGERLIEWKIQSPEIAGLWQQIEETLERRIERAVSPVSPRPMPAIVGPSQLLSQATIADGHVGALGWRPETGAANWDLKQAHHNLLGGTCFLIDNLPLSQELLLAVIGDYADTDGFLPLTPASKHLLDVDGRFPKIADTAIEIIEAAVAHALLRFAIVRIVFQPGNHDPLTTFWLRRLFARIYKDEPRVIVDQSLRNIWVMEFGKTLVVLTHGDKIPMARLPHVVACDFPEEWGRTTQRFGHTGHLHHEHEIKTVGKERDGMTIYQHPTVSSRNMWAAEKGLSAARQLVGHSYRAEGGLAGKLYFHPDMLSAA